MTKPISDKQRQFLAADHRRINLLSGSVRSGKTYISLIAFALFVGSMPANYEFIMVGKTVTALKRNCLNLLTELIGANNFRFNLSQKTASLFGRRVWLEGANDERSESKIRGITLAGAYCDELTLFPQGFYMMLLSRLSMPGAQLYATTNPDSPNHWVKTDIIDNEDVSPQLDYWHFVLDDNDYNDPQYVKDLKASYSGVFYNRLILGQWVIAEGLIYSNFNPELHVVKSDQRVYTEYQISIDYGTYNPFCALLWGLSGGVWYCVKEYWYDGRAKGVQRDDGQYYDELCRFAGDLPINRILVDPSASSFITHARHKGKYAIVHAKNDVLDGIRSVQTALNTGKIKINDCCVNLIREFGLYAWDEKAVEDTPIKENDHALDACRYHVFTNRIALPRNN